MVGAIGLFEADHSLLGRPVQRQVDMRGEFQFGQFSTLGDRLDDFRREKRQPDEAGDVAISHALAAGDRGERSRPRGNEFLEPPMGPCNRLEQRSIRLRSAASAPPILSRISTPRRFIRIAKNRVIGSIAAAPWVPSTGNGRLIESSMPPGFRFTLSTNPLSAAALSASDWSRRLHSPAASSTAGISSAPTPRLQAEALMAA